MNICLLLTGCITPNVSDKSLSGSPELRKSQYIEAISWYLKNTNYSIVFGENSGTDISNEFSEYSGRVEFIACPNDGLNKERGKGYKEMEILEYVYNHSTLLNNINKSGGVIVKITGRLILLNITKIINNFYKHETTWKDKGFVSAYKNARRPFSDCRYIFFTYNFMPYLLRKKDIIHDGHNFELITAEAINDAQSEGIRFIYPTYMSRTHGRAGGIGTSLALNDWDYFKESIKHKIRKIFFRIGIFPLK